MNATMQTYTVDEAIQILVREGHLREEVVSVVDQLINAGLLIQDQPEGDTVLAPEELDSMRAQLAADDVAEDAESYSPSIYPPAPDDILSITQIARTVGTDALTIQSLRHRHADFPEPADIRPAGPVWRWSEIADWLATPRTR